MQIPDDGNSGGDAGAARSSVPLFQATCIAKSPKGGGGGG